ncbi:MAG: hypothetical protein KA319_14485 [Ferruginibacter sp.]|nr:hypothetical protein [Ferruginibacter sp.]
MKVETLFTHIGKFGLMCVGSIYETNDLHAAELVKNGLAKIVDEEAKKEDKASLPAKKVEEKPKLKK